MDKSLKFWNEEKIQKNIFNDPHSNVIKLAVWTGSKSSTEIKACVIKRHVYKILSIRDKEIIDNNKNYQFKLPPPHDEENILTHTVDWNPIHSEQIAVGLANSYVLHWNIETVKYISSHKALIYENKQGGTSFTRSLRTLTCIQWSPKDPNLLIYGTKDPFINLWDVRVPEPIQTYANDGVLDIKFDPHDELQFAVASENHEVTIYDLRSAASDKIRSEKRSISRKFKFSAHENRTLKIEWNPKVRNRLATSGQNNIKIWDLDYTKEYHQLNEMTLITTRNSAYSIKWSPTSENLLASHSHSSIYVEIWDINRRFRPYRHFKEDPISRGSVHNQKKLGKLLIHWHESPHALLTLNTNNADLSMHARRDAINMEHIAPSCAISCSPANEMSFVTTYKPSKRQVSSLPDPDRSCIFTCPISTGDHDYSLKFRHLAVNYQFCESKNTFSELCSHNAQVAESQGLIHVASNWRLLCVLFHAEETLLPFHEEGFNPENVKRSRRSSKYTIYSDMERVLTSESPESVDTDSDNVEYRTSFVSEDDITDEENYTESRDNGYQNWDMLDEPFTQQVVLNTESTECEELSDKSSLPDTDQGLYSYDNYHPDTMSAAPHSRSEQTRVNSGALTRAMLEDLVNEGDVQTACTMLLVLDNKLKRYLDPVSAEALEDLELTWFYSYIDLLSRFRLWNVQAAVMARSPDPIRGPRRNQSVITAMCNRCNSEKGADKYSGILQKGQCVRCGVAVVCSLCRLAVKGLFVWCQGCCHGGHPDHMREWFSRHKLCPAACGHQCEFS